MKYRADKKCNSVIVRGGHNVMSMLTLQQKSEEVLEHGYNADGDNGTTPRSGHFSSEGRGHSLDFRYEGKRLEVRLIDCWSKEPWG